MTVCGDAVVALMASAKGDVFIVAPFVRAEPLRRILECIRDDVQVAIVTRWRPSDILAGASDLDVFDVAVDKSAACSYDTIFTQSSSRRMHGASSVLRTLRERHWAGRRDANLELLTKISRQAQEIVEFEKGTYVGCGESHCGTS